MQSTVSVNKPVMSFFHQSDYFGEFLTNFLPFFTVFTLNKPEAEECRFLRKHTLTAANINHSGAYFLGFNQLV
ncbi:hypothetical protein SAMN02745133_00733 [Desulforamulus putei DSM 12395]|uniref:Uncharacterized protein n=1 Tax=Desulforamulus putei DSM 12395 TaxID=1121429 RepID=A0A1M4UQX8_9FIRM|nr:hypothetical protein [Desulforamulus putei]SHE59104.1 hypothetical protein SAMN02745133_00733 [Desulforamulus putei DSM 12395]